MGGLQVTTISAEDAAQLYDCRLALEQLAVTEACIHASMGQLKQLEAFVLRAEQLGREPSSLSVIDLLNLDYGFHRLIAESSGNHCLVVLLDQVFDKMVLLRMQTTRRNPNVLEIRIEHRQIYEAIAQRQPEAAVAAIQDHLIASKARVTKEL
jgi:DNA-binding GntR family transcriptional regulator